MVHGIQCFSGRARIVDSPIPNDAASGPRARFYLVEFLARFFVDFWSGDLEDS
ncbi:MAG: hypothetical protein UX35_C0005G0045 [Microgenomates group bacterium GW2011_GWA1_46_15]|nr:MAG: hypothetical protein UX00_C0007G0029 [Microgenomates group bacterium GW2011_GWB1_45_17]KKU23543.1 MAG: hypothetical protein UX35_C0005G0045 [Microgenomates group bacterium GW2011_GWA1_46_15]KKU24428.1 MAG: hypothetical protein UX36_C0001G0045 [Microgenomates group bacterium GW2011_GWC1_46_15]